MSFQMWFLYLMLCVPFQNSGDQIAKLIEQCSRPESSIVRQLVHKVRKELNSHFKRGCNVLHGHFFSCGSQSSADTRQRCRSPVRSTSPEISTLRRSSTSWSSAPTCGCATSAERPSTPAFIWIYIWRTSIDMP